MFPSPAMSLVCVYVCVLFLTCSSLSWIPAPPAHLPPISSSLSLHTCHPSARHPSCVSAAALLPLVTRLLSLLQYTRIYNPFKVPVIFQNLLFPCFMFALTVSSRDHYIPACLPACHLCMILPSHAHILAPHHPSHTAIFQN